MKVKLTVFLLFQACFSWACSTAPESANTVSPILQPSPSGTPSVTVIEPPANLDLPPATSNKIRLGDTIAERSNRKNRVDANPNATPAPLQFRPAAENSRAALAMNSDGSIREVRIFDKHPVLASVEAISAGGLQKDVTIKLRSGKVVKLRTDRVSDLATVSIQTLLDLAGK